MKVSRITLPMFAFLLMSCSLIRPGAQRARQVSTAPADWPLAARQQLTEFDLMARSMRDLYIDPTKIDAKWQQKVDAIRAKFSETTTGDDGSTLVRDLLATLDDGNLQVTNLPDDGTTAVDPAIAGGLGVQVDLPSKDHDRVLVLSVSDGSAAQSAGIKAHDAIVSVDGRPVGNDPSILRRVRGRVGTQVVIGVQTPGRAARDVTITRRAVSSASPTTGRMIPGTNYGLIQPGLATLPDQLRGEVTTALRDLSKNRPLDGLILDLRVMRGPDFPTEDLLALFANRIVATRYARGQAPSPFSRTAVAAGQVDLSGRNIDGSQTVPLVILVGSLTNGQAEAFAGILQDLQRAIVIGNTTQGNPVILADVDLPTSGLRMRIPSAEYRTLKGVGWLKTGVIPNPIIETSWEAYTDDNDPVLKLAVDQLNKR